jgi:hypothetical protein
MSNKTLGVILIVVGVLIVIADLVLGFTGFSALGIGAGFGLKKIILGIAGVIVALIGAYIRMRVTSTNK